MKLLFALTLLVPVSGQFSRPPQTDSLYSAVEVRSNLQTPATASAVTGVIERIARAKVQVKTTALKSITIHTDRQTVVTKSRRTGDHLSILKTGDKVRVRYNPRTLIAIDISADSVTFRAKILRVNSGNIEVRIETGSTGQIGQEKSVRLCVDTMTMGIGLRPGENVNIVGWDFGDRGVDATSIAVYNTDLRC